MACITVGSPSGPVEDFLEEWTLERLEEVSPSVVPEATKVFVNGRWVGVHRAPAELVRTLRALRRQVDVNTEVGVVHDFAAQELRIYTDAGRTSRPLLIVDGQRLRLRKGHVRRLLERAVDLVEDPAAAAGVGGGDGGGDDGGGAGPAMVEDAWTWGRLVREGLVEYIDAEEEETTMIAMAIGDVQSARLDPAVSFFLVWVFRGAARRRFFFFPSSFPLCFPPAPLADPLRSPPSSSQHQPQQPQHHNNKPN